MDAGLAFEGVPALADHDQSRLGQARHSADRLSGHSLLFGAENRRETEVA